MQAGFDTLRLKGYKSSLNNMKYSNEQYLYYYISYINTVNHCYSACKNLTIAHCNILFVSTVNFFYSVIMLEELTSIISSNYVNF